MTINLQTYSSETLERFQLCDNIDVCLNQLKFKNDLAVAVSNEYVKISESFVNAEIYCFGNMNEMYEYDLKFLIRKNFKLFKKFNEFIGASQGAGLINKWLKLSQRRPKMRQSNRKLYIIEAHSGWLIACGMLLGATVTFFVEHLVYRNISKSKPTKLWKFFDFLINPNRYFFLNNLE